MLVLALDTSTRLVSIALCTEDVFYGEYTWQAGGNHSRELLSNIQRLLLECDLTMQHLEGIAVATGPGSFTGVRVALATAKTLAYVLKKPLVGVSTLDTIAIQQQYWHGPVCAVLEAGRSELYAACYLFDTVRTEEENIRYSMRQLGEYVLLSPQSLADYVQEQANTWVGVPGERQLPPVLFCGEMSAASREALRTALPEQCLFANTLQATRRASLLAALAQQRLQEGRIDDPLLLEPLYLRRPSITTSTRKQPLLGEKSQHSTTGQSQTEREEGALRH